jgi:trehalose 6-phosphate synthase
MAAEIHFALEMDAKERRDRMQRMRQIVKEQNIYRWAGNLIAELCQVRLEAKEMTRERAANPPSVA